MCPDISINFFASWEIFHAVLYGVQWLSGRVLDSRPRGCGFEPHWCHCVVSLSKNINPSLVLVQPKKTCPYITERLSMGCKESNQTNKIMMFYVFCYFSFKINFFERFFQEYHQCETVWTQIWLNVVLGLIWGQTVCKGYMHTTLGGKELTLKAPITTAAKDKFCDIFPDF